MICASCKLPTSEKDLVCGKYLCQSCFEAKAAKHMLSEGSTTEGEEHVAPTRPEQLTALAYEQGKRASHGPRTKYWYALECCGLRQEFGFDAYEEMAAFLKLCDPEKYKDLPSQVLLPDSPI